MRDSVTAADRGGPQHQSTFYTDINSMTTHFEVHYFRDFYGNMRGSFMFHVALDTLVITHLYL